MLVLGWRGLREDGKLESEGRNGKRIRRGGPRRRNRRLERLYSGMRIPSTTKMRVGVSCYVLKSR